MMSARLRPLVVAVAVAVALLVPAFARAADSISVEKRGSLSEVLRKIADEGELNLVVLGRLDEPAEIYLHDVKPEDALRTLAKHYGLSVEREGNIFTVRRSGAPPSWVNGPPPVPAAPSAPAAPAAPAPSEAGAPPAPAGPPVPAPPESDAVTGKDKGMVGNGRIHVREGQTVHEAVSFGGPLIIDGHVEQDAVVIGGDMKLGPKGRVDGDAVVIGGSIERAKGSQVKGDQVRIGVTGVTKNDEDEADAESDEGDEAPANVSAGLTKDEDGDYHYDYKPRSAGIADFLLRFLALFVLGFLALMFFPQRMRQLGDELELSPWRAALTGFVGLIVALGLSVLLVITLVGIPFALLLWLAMAVATVLGFAAAASRIGSKLPVLRGRKSQAFVLAAGLLVMLLLFEIPVLGALGWFVMTMAALGAVVRTRFGARGRGLPEPLGREPAPV